MNDEDILINLEKLLNNLGIEVRYENGDFFGGLYRYHGKSQVIINKALNAKKKIQIIANELRVNVDLDSLYIVPALREVIENADSLD
ncbi:hypothetical protein GWO43_12890 [candidate division KSB1 bacterium]|nr:hypothetical protein [candidate division KSB1 bacterium]NIR71325.1 hypothetical protein [candidate division KSB1 bacterium]NIS24835.1 hypothetical protein [candidate division KSB1 bacterium]NIT71755.1 hypothetical protein [candidate division KSB1 bacterium]NIU25470.1 hypothetical protein [candidate division KSB1 bacterium]